jgi:hypothetical protein
VALPAEPPLLLLLPPLPFDPPVSDVPPSGELVPPLSLLEQPTTAHPVETHAIDNPRHKLFLTDIFIFKVPPNYVRVRLCRKHCILIVNRTIHGLAICRAGSGVIRRGFIRISVRDERRYPRQIPSNTFAPCLRSRVAHL